MEITIVGLPYYAYPNLSLEVGDKVVLAWDRTNKHSGNAVAVSFAGEKIGYITGRESEKVLKLFTDPNSYKTATITDVRQSCLKAELDIAPAITTIGYGTSNITKCTLDDHTDALKYAFVNLETVTNTKKELTMFEKIVTNNTTLAQSAAFLEAGRIANNTAAKFVASKSPLMVKGYVDTAFGKLLIANAAAVAAEKFRPADRKLAKLANAMITQAYQEVYQLVDIEKMLNEMLSSESVKVALSKLDASEAE